LHDASIPRIVPYKLNWVYVVRGTQPAKEWLSVGLRRADNTSIGRPIPIYGVDNGPAAALALGQTNAGSGGSAFPNQPGVVNDPVTPKLATGLNSIGMLVRPWGKCTYIQTAAGSQTNFWIWDGSDVWDGTMNGPDKVMGVKVKVPGVLLTPIALGNYYGVTGIMRTDSAVPTCVRWLWPRTELDIRKYAP